MQIVQNADTQEIICLHFANGSCHDFDLYKKSKLKIHKRIKQKVDKAYVGILGYHRNTDIPKKSSKHHPLTKTDKKQNRQFAKERIGIEHTNRKMKIFRIVKEVYRNHTKFGMRATFIAAITNANLTCNAA